LPSLDFRTVLFIPTKLPCPSSTKYFSLICHLQSTDQQQNEKEIESQKDKEIKKKDQIIGSRKYYKTLNNFLLLAILAITAQSCHNLVPPDILEPLVKTIADQFVSDRRPNEVIAIGFISILWC
jgi:hypothetical protein